MNVHDDHAEVTLARVSCVNAPWISPPNRGKRDALVSLHNDHYLWTEHGDTIGFVRIYTAHREIKDLFYIPPRFVGQDLLSNNLYLLKYLCPISGKTVQQEIERLIARVPHKGVQVGGYAVGHVAKIFVDNLINDMLRAIRNATHSGYHDQAGRLWFEAPIKREHLSVRTVGELRRAGLIQ
jgi:hypothetical protein